jgi:hypothetical protein
MSASAAVILWTIAFLFILGQSRLFHDRESDLRYDVEDLRDEWPHVQSRFAGYRRYLSTSEPEPDPAPFTPYNRVLGLVCAYNYGHIDPLTLILNEYLYMCEGGWDPIVALFTTERWTSKVKRLYADKLYCYRTNSSVEIRHMVFPKTINVALAAEHRKYMAKVVNNFDVFIYHEDDILMRFSHLNAFVEETKRLKSIMSASHGLTDHIIGFQRYRRLYKEGDHQKGGWGEQDIIEQEMLEEVPTFNEVCMGETIPKAKQKPYFYVTGNTHTGAYMMTREQVLLLQKKCLFLNQSSPSREYMSSFSLFDHKEYHCGLNKLIPAERLMTFQIWHYFPQRMVSWYPTFLADESLRRAKDFRSANAFEMPDCWLPIHQEALAADKADEEDSVERKRLKDLEGAKAKKQKQNGGS